MKLGLGTAQFGLDYGVTNKMGKVSTRTVSAILKIARERKVEVIDTAAAYGNSEKVLGLHLKANDEFRIVTKTPSINRSTITQSDAKNLRESFMSSLSRLKKSRVHGLLVHNASDLIARDSERLFDEMRLLQQSGFVEKLGVSVYSGTEIDQIVNRHSIDLIQVPLNVLDQRLIASGHLSHLRDIGIEIHARSVFLQGLLLLDPWQLPDQFADLREPLSRYREFLNENGLTKAEGAIAFLRETERVDHAIVGVLSPDNLAEVCDALYAPITRQLNFFDLALHDHHLLNPTSWNPVQH